MVKLSELYAPLDMTGMDPHVDYTRKVRNKIFDLANARSVIEQYKHDPECVDFSMRFPDPSNVETAFYAVRVSSGQFELYPRENSIDDRAVDIVTELKIWLTIMDIYGGSIEPGSTTFIDWHDNRILRMTVDLDSSDDKAIFLTPVETTLMHDHIVRID